MEENFKEEILENLGTPHEIVLFLDILKTFATRSCRKFKPEVMVEWKAPYKSINIKTHLGSQPHPPSPTQLTHPKHIIHTYFLVIVQIWAGILHKIVTWIITKLITSELDAACKESHV